MALDLITSAAAEAGAATLGEIAELNQARRALQKVTKDILRWLQK